MKTARVVKYYAMIFVLFFSIQYPVMAQKAPTKSTIIPDTKSKSSTGVSSRATAEKPVTLLDYLTIFPKDVGKFSYQEAIGICEGLNSNNSNGYSDWRLPTMAELKLMLSNKKAIKGMVLTESYGSLEGILDFSNESIDKSSGWKEKNFNFRPVRTNQPAKLAEIELSVSTETVSFPASGGSAEIYIASNTEWETTDILTWCPPTSSSEMVVTLNCEENKNAVARNDEFKIKAGDKEVKITISQQAAAINLSVSSNSISFDNSGGTEMITVITNTTDWDVTGLANWCSISKCDTGFTLTCNENKGIGRNVSLKVVADNKEVEIRISQKAGIKDLLQGKWEKITNKKP
jgi:hypothetical protein